MNPDRKLQLSMAHLDVELVSRDSGLNYILELGTSMRDRGTVGSVPVIRKALKLVEQACPAFKQCTCSPHCILCRSGEDGKQPYRGKECRKCSVGQISRTGQFVGDRKSPLVHINTRN